MNIFNLAIDGENVETSESFDVLNPATEEVVASCAQASLEHLDSAVAAAKAAFPLWSAREDKDRVAALLKIADLIEENHADGSKDINPAPKSVIGTFSTIVGRKSCASLAAPGISKDSDKTCGTNSNQAWVAATLFCGSEPSPAM